MPRVVLDTNVIVSAWTFLGLPRRVLDLCRKGEIDLVISPFILVETQTTLEQDFHWNHERAEEATTSLAKKVGLSPHKTHPG